MGEKLQNINTLDPPPQSTSQINDETLTTRSKNDFQQPTTDLTALGLDPNQKQFGTHPNASISSTSDQNLVMGPSPMNSEGPKTLGVVSPASDLAGIEKTNPEEPKTDFSITPNPQLQTLHAPDHPLAHHLEHLRQKYQPNRSPDARSPSDSANVQLAKKLSIPDATLGTLKNAPYRVDQHEIPLHPVKNHNFLTSDDFGRKTEPPTAGRRTSGGPSTNFHQNVRSVNLSSFPASIFPHEAQTVLNQGRKTYATAVSGRPGLSQAERSERKSFASVLQATNDSSSIGFASKEPFIHLGEPAVDLSDSEEAILADPYKYTLVGKFPHRKPTMRKVREIFSKFGFHGCFEVGLIDIAHILIHLTHEEDYSRLFLKPSWYIDGCPMRILKWTCDFRPEQETPIVPVWVSFPLLPVHLRHKGFLFALSRAIGIPLRIDEATSDLRRPSEARVCIEVNLELRLPDRVWIERGGNRGFWQTVIYEKRPVFCFNCRHMGHSYDTCTSGTPHPPPVVVPPPVQPPAAGSKVHKGKGKVTFVEPRKQWVPVSAVPTMVLTTPATVQTESATTSTVPTSTPMTVAPEVPPVDEHIPKAPIEVDPPPTITTTAVTSLPTTEAPSRTKGTQSSQISGSALPINTCIVDLEVPSFTHLDAEPPPKAPIEVPTSPIINAIAHILTPSTEAAHETTQISSPPLKTHTDGTQSAQGSATGIVQHTTIAQGLLAEISSERHSIKHMLIDHFKKDHGMKVGSTMRLAIEDLVIKLFGEGPSESKTPTHTPSPSPSNTAPTQHKLKEHIQRDMDGMGLGDCMQNVEDDVPTVSRSLSHTSDVAAQSTMRSDAPVFRPTFSASSPGQFYSPTRVPSRRRDPSPVSEPDYADYYDPEEFQTRRMTRSMSMYYHPKIYPREYP